MKIIKIPIFYKYFFVIALILIISILTSILSNIVFLNKYYVKNQKSKVKKIASELYQNKEKDKYNDLKENFILKNNIEIIELPINPSKNISGMHNMGRGNNRGIFFRHTMMRQNFIYDIFTITELNNLKLGENKIKTYENKMMGSKELILIIKKDKENIISIISSINSLDEAAKSANELYLINGIIVLILSLLISIIFAKKITNPIKELTKKTKEMAKLNFTEKIELNTGDEIEDLGDAFNYLNSQLSINIGRIKSISENLEQDLLIKEEMEKKRKEFIANLSHELKTPLALQKAYAEGLKEGVAKKEELDYYCDVILEENEKMDSLVKKLLELSKLQSINDTLKEEEFYIDKLIKDVLKKFQFYLKRKDVKLKFQMEKDIKIKADIKKIEQVIENFVSNAVKYVEEAGFIFCEIKEEEQDIIIKIFNSGSNIEKNEKDNIWEAFYKIDKSRKRDENGGTGLGLSIVKEILLKYKSDFGFNNVNYNEKDGVEFYFTLKKNKLRF